MAHVVRVPRLVAQGDTHDPHSLVEHDTLPRLVDALLSEFPPFAFATSNAIFTSETRHAHESFLGFNPDTIRKRWKHGRSSQKRFPVEPSSEEYKAIVGVFKAQPRVKRFYFPQDSTASLQVRPSAVNSLL